MVFIVCVYIKYRKKALVHRRNAGISDFGSRCVPIYVYRGESEHSKSIQLARAPRHVTSMEAKNMNEKRLVLRLGGRERRNRSTTTCLAPVRPAPEEPISDWLYTGSPRRRPGLMER